MAGVDDEAGAVGAAQVVQGDAEVVGGLPHNEGGRDLLAGRVGDNVLEDHLRQGLVDGLLVQGGERRHADEGALQLADVRGDAGGDVLQHVQGQVQALGTGLAREDRDAGLQVRGLHVRQQAPLEAGAQALVQASQRLGRLVGGEDHLLARGVQGVEGVEELLQGGLLALQELDVVHQEDVDVPVAALEGLQAAVVAVAVTQAGDEVRGELLGVDVLDADLGVEGTRVVADGVQEVGLAQAGAPVDEQGVVGAGGRLRHGDGGGVGEPVGGAGDVGVKGVARVEAGAVAAGGALADAGCGGCGGCDDERAPGVEGDGRGAGLRRGGWYVDVAAGPLRGGGQGLPGPALTAGARLLGGGQGGGGRRRGGGRPRHRRHAGRGGGQHPWGEGRCGRRDGDDGSAREDRGGVLQAGVDNDLEGDVGPGDAGQRPADGAA